MIPVVIEDMIRNTLNNQIHAEKRQFYYDSLLRIKTHVDKAINDYNRERNFK